jgi:YbbR-like protein
LLSLLLAVGIWLTVHKILTETPLALEAGGTDSKAAPTTIIYSNQPVQLLSASADVHLYRPAPSEVKVTLIGPADLMANLQASQISALVDLTDTNLSSHHSRPVVISPPPGVTLIGISPPVVTILPPKS